jgi:hypothetical protein
MQPRFTTHASPATKPHLFEKRFYLESNTAHVFPADAGIWIEIDA